MALPEKLTFKAWQRARLFDNASEQGARLGGKLTLTLTDSKTGQQAAGDVPFMLMAAADVGTLKPRAIKHMAPAPFTRDAETTKFVHIDFWEKDLPWRYTPKLAVDHPAPNNKILHPWLVLLVGTGEEIQVEGGLVRAAASVLKAHRLDESHLWAHTQFDGHTTVGRIISPRGMELDDLNKPLGLRPQHEYVSVLVPAFNQAGQPMWNANGEANFGEKNVLPALHFWRFWTAEAGDFETLAAALHIPPAGDVGKAALHYRRDIPADGVHIQEKLEVRGAITSMQAEVPPAADILQRIKNDVDSLNDEIAGTIGLPHYGRPWLPNPDDIADGWPGELNDDPRFRSVSGLGTWMGVEAQEALMDAAVKQAGALREAGQRIGHLAFGLWAAGRLWDRRLPSDPLERLRILGPLMARMVAADGGLVLDRVTSGSSPLASALFSSAAQRLLRDRSTQTRHLAGENGGINRNEAFKAANQPQRQPDRAPKGLPHFDNVAEEFANATGVRLSPLEDVVQLDNAWITELLESIFEAVRVMSQHYRRKRDELRQAGQEQDIPILRSQLVEELSALLQELLQTRLSERGLPCEGGQIVESIGEGFLDGTFEFLSRVLEDDSAQRRLRDALWRALRQCMASRPCQEQIHLNIDVPNLDTFCDELIATLLPEPVLQQKPIDLGLLSDLLYKALDPRQPDAPARVRLCSRLEGIDCTRLIPPEFPIGLDFPTWDLLKQYDKEWLLPGVGALEKDSITALQTNPVFIDAYMVGINTQFMSEMRWRDLAVARTCTPLRMFWGQIDYARRQRRADIEPLAEWAKATADPLGALSHQTIKPTDENNQTGSRLIITFRSDLFRRYPSTLVYLVKPLPGQDVDPLLKATPQLDRPDAVPEADIEQWRKTTQYFGPTFVGTITPEITFFAFDVTPSDLEQYWLVLDEPPAELRFRNDKVPVRTNSATFARSTLDQPTRVAISGEELERQAEHL